MEAFAARSDAAVRIEAEEEALAALHRAVQQGKSAVQAAQTSLTAKEESVRAFVGVISSRSSSAAAVRKKLGC